MIYKNKNSKCEMTDQKMLSIIKDYYEYVIATDLKYTHKDTFIYYHFCEKGFQIHNIDYKHIFIQYSHKIKHGIECIYNYKENKLEMIEYNFNNHKTKDFNESIKIFKEMLIEHLYIKDLTSIIYGYIA